MKFILYKRGEFSQKTVMVRQKLKAIHDARYICFLSYINKKKEKKVSQRLLLLLLIKPLKKRKGTLVIGFLKEVLNFLTF